MKNVIMHHKSRFVPFFLKIILAAPLMLTCSCSSRKIPGVFPVPSDRALTSLDRIVETISANKDKIPTRKMVVYEFTDMAGRARPEGRLVAERLTTKLAQNGEFQVIERSRLEAALKELRLQGTGILDEKTAISAGRFLGAEAVLTGTIARVNGKFEINARAVSVATGEIITGVIVTLREDELLVKEDAPAYGYPVPVRPQAAVLPAAPKGWELWPGWNGEYGRFKLENRKLYYYLTSRQHDELDAPKDGYFPGLLLAKPFKGEKWSVEMKVRYDTYGGGGRYISFYVWLGSDKTRPTWAPRENSTFVIGGYRQTDPGSGNFDSFRVQVNNPGKVLNLDPAISYLRIEREKSVFRVYTSIDGLKYREVLSMASSVAGSAETQKIVIGGQAYSGSTPESYAEYDYIKLNGKPLF